MQGYLCFQRSGDRTIAYECDTQPNTRLIQVRWVDILHVGRFPTAVYSWRRGLLFRNRGITPDLYEVDLEQQNKRHIHLNALVRALPFST